MHYIVIEVHVVEFELHLENNKSRKNVETQHEM